MVLNHNLVAMNAQRQYGLVNDNKSKSMEKLSTGLKINRAADDAAGLKISEKLRWQIRGLDRASQNIEEGISLVQVADGALEEVDALIHRMRELSVQAANDTNTDTDRAAIQAEIDQCITEIDRIAETTSYNELPILRASDVYLDNGVVSKVTTPTMVAEGVFNMNDKNLPVKRNGIDTKVEGMKFDFDNVDIDELDGKSFFVTCSQSCDQSFQFRFQKGSSNVTGTVGNPSDSIYVNIGLDGITSGQQVAAAIGNALSLPGITNNSMFQNNGNDGGNYRIGHANGLYIDGSALTFYTLTPPASSGKSSFDITLEDGTRFNDVYLGSVYMNGLEEIVTIKKSPNVWNINIQAGALEQQAIKLPLIWLEAKDLGIDPLDVSTHKKAGRAMSALDKALDWVNEKRANFGAVQNRLEHAYQQDRITSENTSAAESRIRDTDMAKEMTEFSKLNILGQTGESMMAQANSFSEAVLQLLQ